MDNLRTPSLRYQLSLAFLFLVLMQTRVTCHVYKVGDLHAWGVPSSGNSQVYAKWSKQQTFAIGDSLLFLYPPSEDSVLQVKAEQYNSCDLKDPILKMDNGNSLFNVTSEGEFFFISGQKGHCEKRQKIQILVGNVTATAFSPTSGPAGTDDTAPSYQNVFGSIPAASSAPALAFSASLLVAAFGFAVLG